MPENKAPISVLIGSYKDGPILKECLKSVLFCDEIVVLDFNSGDETEQLASEYATKYILEPEDKGYIDAYMPKYIPMLRYDWIILIDPDERISKELAADIRSYISNPQPFKSLIRVPFMNYYMGRRLKGGPYRKPASGRLLFYRPGLKISDQIHFGIKPKPGYGLIELPFTGKNYNEHYWCNGLSQLNRKYSKYAKAEGKAFYLKGKRFGWLSMFYETCAVFFESFFKQKFYREGLLGLRFALTDARYRLLSWMHLRRYQQELVRNGTMKSRSEQKDEEWKVRIADFREVSAEFIQSMANAGDSALLNAISDQYRKAARSLIEELLEQNDFNNCRRVMEIASTVQGMDEYIRNELLLGQIELIQKSGSYRLARVLSRIIPR